MSNPQALFLPKVAGLITRKKEGGVDLLLFKHPYSGVQFPAGTVEEGEDPAVAVRREAFEETGLTDLRLVAHPGVLDDPAPDGYGFMLHPSTVYARPDPTSFDWARFMRGSMVRVLRRAEGYLQVSYEEPDRYPDAGFTTYVITGWVPATAVCYAQRRYFYHFEAQAWPGESWQVRADYHRFTLFWAPLDALPEIIHPQQGWLPYVREVLGYPL
jgi:8-oxo-dGTP pyrophosphatase MutT (NUDIX family)